MTSDDGVTCLLISLRGGWLLCFLFCCVLEEDHPFFGLSTFIAVTVVTLVSISIIAKLFNVAAVLVIAILCPAWFYQITGIEKYVMSSYSVIVNRPLLATIVLCSLLLYSTI